MGRLMRRIPAAAEFVRSYQDEFWRVFVFRKSGKEMEFVAVMK